MQKHNYIILLSQRNCEINCYTHNVSFLSINWPGLLFSQSGNINSWSWKEIWILHALRCLLEWRNCVHDWDKILLIIQGGWRRSGKIGKKKLEPISLMHWFQLSGSTCWRSDKHHTRKQRTLHIETVDCLTSGTFHDCYTFVFFTLLSITYIANGNFSNEMKTNGVETAKIMEFDSVISKTT